MWRFQGELRYNSEGLEPLTNCLMAKAIVVNSA